MSRLGVLAMGGDITTARYFEGAAAAAGHDVVAMTAIDRRSSRGLSLLLVVDPFVAPPAGLREIDCPTIGYVIDAHQQLAPRLAYSRYLDHVFIAQPDYLPRFRALPHLSAHWLPLACDPEIHFVSGLERKWDVGFVGKLGQPGSDRNNTLSRVLASFQTNDWRRGYSPRDMGEVYSRSKIVFNKSINGDLNMRFFEGLAAGALLVTDRIGNGLDRMGDAGVHFVTYDNADEAIEKILYYLSHDREREVIAKAGQQLALSRFTYADRLKEMLDVVASNGGARAPARDAARPLEAVWRSEHMRLSGTPVSSALSLLAEGNASGPVIANLSVGVARGIIRPIRQRLQASGRAKG